MNRTVIAGVLLLANVAGTATAADCSALGGAMTGSAIQTLLNPGTGVYACYNNGSRRENNETLLTGPTSGTVQEYHNGGTTVENEGTYAITGGAGTGVITYSYTSGGTFGYNICVNPVTGSTYQFVNTSTAAGYNIVVSTSTNAC